MACFCFVNPNLSILLSFRYLDVFQPLQLGGVKETSLHRRYQGFKGCLRNLVVDSQVTHSVTFIDHFTCLLGKWAEILITVSHPNPQVYDLASPGESVGSNAGCTPTDGVCVTAGSPSCGGHASCQAEWGSFSCECRPGFTGHKCDTGETSICVCVMLDVLNLYSPTPESTEKIRRTQELLVHTWMFFLCFMMFTTYFVLFFS